MLISVVIPSYNSQDTIQKCLDSLANQSYEGEYEIILVDSSDDNTPEIVSSGYPHVKLIHLEKKTDPGTARNNGIQIAQGDILAFIDSDCTARPDWLERMVARHDSTYRVVGGGINNANSACDIVGWAGYMAEFREFLPTGTPREVIHIPTCNISYERAIFTKFGIFEGEYYPQEDLLYNYKITKNAERILFDPHIQVFHQQRSKLGDFLRHQRRVGRSAFRVLRVTDLKGSFIARHRLLGFLVLPFLPIVKLVRTLLQFLRKQPKAVIRRPSAIGALALGLVFWGFGFAEGIWLGEKKGG